MSNFLIMQAQGKIEWGRKEARVLEKEKENGAKEKDLEG